MTQKGSLHLWDVTHLPQELPYLSDLSSLHYPIPQRQEQATLQ